jgi:glycosyltransferase involved in cell wall biosynthesis
VPRARLLVVTPSLGGGGAERHLLRILPSLRAAFDVHLATLRSGGPLEADRDADVPVHRIESLHWATAAWRLRRVLVRIQPSAALGFQEAANIPLLLAVRLLVRSGRPAVAVSTQSAPSVVLADARRRTRWRVATAMRRLYPSADCLVVASEGVTADLAAVAPAAAGRIRVIHNAGIDAAVTSRATEPWTHPFLAHRAPLLVACGRLTEQKDYPTLLRAVADLRQRRDVRLIVLGDGPLRGALDRLARDLGIDAIVDLAGYAPNPFPCMARAAAYVLSSRSEGFGNVLVEALALGVPIVSTDCPYGPGEILARGRYGVLVPPGDPAALADAIDRLLADPDRARSLAAAGPERAAAFTAEQSGAAYVAMLTDLLARRRG